MIEAEPCDVCRSKPDIEDHFAEWRIRCPGLKFDCALRFIWASGTQERAIEQWNNMITWFKERPKWPKNQ